MNREFLYSPLSQRLKTFEDSIPLMEDTERVDVFHPFLSEENLKPIPSSIHSRNRSEAFSSSKKRSEFFATFRNKKHEIKNMFNLKNNPFKIVHGNKPKALKRLEKGMKIFFFGPKGFITERVACLKDCYRKKHPFRVGINEKILAGNLDYLDMKNKTSYTSRIDEAKRQYLKRSSNFAVNDVSNPVVKYGTKKFKENIKEIMKNFENDEKKISLENKKYKTLHSAKPNRRLQSSKSRVSTAKKNGMLKKTSNIKTFYDTQFIMKQAKGQLKSPQKVSKRLRLSTDNNRCYSSSPRYREQKLRITTELSTIDKNYNKLESTLCKIIDEQNYHGDKREEEIKRDKIAKDIEIITGAKLRKQKSPKSKTKNLVDESVKPDKDAECRRAIIKLSDGITKMSDATALKFADEIMDDYYRKTRYGNFYIPQKRIYTNLMFDTKIRNKCNGNYEKMERMTFSLDRLKQRYNLTENNNVN